MVSERRTPSLGDRAQYAVLRAFAALLGLLSWSAAAICFSATRLLIPSGA